MKKIPFLLIILSLSLHTVSQDSIPADEPENASARLLGADSKLTIGGYAQIDYNQPIEAGTRMNGKMDVHRLVLLFGYNFNSRVSFITEVEIEHVKEVYVEQAFLNYKIRPWLNLRGGLLLIPMGIINEYHEPPTFNGVERPNLDSYIIPTTWREIGLGISGTIRQASLKYQLYAVNGFLSYQEEGWLNGRNGFRGARQKGADAISLSPNITGKVEYFGVRRLNVGISGYMGNSSSTLYKKVDESSEQDVGTADSTVVGSAILGLDARYSLKGLALRGQLYYGSFSNTDEYNAFTGKDFGSAMFGYYAEVAYDLFSLSENIKGQLVPFVRYENYNTQHAVADGITYDPANHREEIIFGIGWKPVSGVAVKADYQLYRSEAVSTFNQQFNAGIGIWF